MKVPLLDLKPQYRAISEEIHDAIKDVVESQHFILGPKVATLETEIATYTRSSYALGVSSGTDALLISLMAAGIGDGDLVLTTPYSFFATAGCIARLGAIPVFADIDPDTYNLSPESADKVIGEMTADQKARLKAVIPVHLYGQCADMDPLMHLAEKYGLTVIEDAAQAIGSEYKNCRAGSMGHFGCFSFFPSKNLGAFGDGGIVTVGSDELIENLRILRAHGSKPKYFHKIVGGNFRLDSLQAAIVSVKLKYLDAWTHARQENAAQYREMFGTAGLDKICKLPVEKENRHIYNQFVVRVPDRRDDLRQYLAEHEIGSEVYYPVPLHLQECFSGLGYKSGDFPVSEDAAVNTIAIPIYPELTVDQQTCVVDRIAAFYKG
ncbi:MAG: DegT/DnrJ/EryC1/StrS family aminotransferase [Desulfobacteraceae bacterium]|nr:DegT/DnrJ/EryC1/StrS family aminotransferase [Desulfobacteraceae bacterium]